jgi:hypothetical protein
LFLAGLLSSSLAVARRQNPVRFYAAGRSSQRKDYTRENNIVAKFISEGVAKKWAKI